MSPTEIERLLESPIHAVRVGAVSVMDWQARRRTTPDERRHDLFDLYIRRHDRIDTWDLVDRSAVHVIGEYRRWAGCCEKPASENRRATGHSLTPMPRRCRG